MRPKTKTEAWLNSRYITLGGLDKVISAYIAGEITIRDIGCRIGVSRMTVNNDLRSFLGKDKFQETIAERRHRANLRKKLQEINSGGRGILAYHEALICLEHDTIKKIKFLSEYKTIFNLARSLVLKPSQVLISSHCIKKVKGKKGNIKIKYAEPNENLIEYRKDRYRFKITKNMMDGYEAIIFCLKTNAKISYYVFSTKELIGIQSLNLQFDRHDTSKYAINLEKIEKTTK